jgi:phosphoribosylanthranilate isomerase
VPTPIIQIYEIQDPSQAGMVIEEGVDHVGSVVLSATDWKNQELCETIRLVQSAGRTSSLIPLFSDIDAIRRVLDYYRPDIIHFCEMLSFDVSDPHAFHHMIANQTAIRSEYPAVRIMRSLPIGKPDMTANVPTLALADRFEVVSDLFLTDTLLSSSTDAPADQPVKGFVGITGETCDWSVARALVRQARIPVILAGGLSPDNVHTAIATVAPAGVDSCTATNQVDARGRPIRFRKDRTRVRQFVKAAQKKI